MHTLSQTTQHATRPDMMLAAVLHLMSHYTVSHEADHKGAACIKLASVIERHLHALADLPELSPILRATCENLSEQWTQHLERRLPTRPVGGLLSGRWPSLRVHKQARSLP